MTFRSIDDAAEVLPVATDGAVLPVYRLSAPATQAPVLVWGHANGFPAGAYLPLLRRLQGEARIFAFDARGHGGAAAPEGPLDEVYARHRFADDLAAVLARIGEAVGGAPIHYAGHSLNAAAALGLLSVRAARVASLTLVEPPLFPARDAACRAEAEAKQRQLILRTAARRSAWPSREALAAYLRGRGAFVRFADGFVEAYCRAALKPDGAGGFTLASPPAVEATIFNAHAEDGLWRALPRIRQPVHLIGGDPDRPDRDWVTAAMPEMAARLPHGRLTVVRGAGHMVPCEQPEAMLAILRRALSTMAER